MDAAIPPEFETLARELVAAGTFASVDEAVAAALRNEVDRVEHLRGLIDPAIAEAERGETVDGRMFLRERIAAIRTRLAG